MPPTLLPYAGSGPDKAKCRVQKATRSEAFACYRYFNLSQFSVQEFEFNLLERDLLVRVWSLITLTKMRWSCGEFVMNSDFTNE